MGMIWKEIQAMIRTYTFRTWPCGDNMSVRAYVVSEEGVFRYCYDPHCSRPIRHRISRGQAAREMYVLSRVAPHWIEDNDND